MSTSIVRALGVLIAAGAVIWSIGWLQAGVRPIGDHGMPINDQVEIWASGVFQLGLLALLFVMRATLATGLTRAGRWILTAEIVAVILAIGWTIPYLFEANREPNVLLTVLDVFWPLSMVGMIAVGVMVIRARRWPAPVRYLPLAASLIIPVDIVAALLGVSPWAEIVIRSVYLALTYTLLGAGVFVQVAPLAEPAASAPETTLEPRQA